MDHEVLPPVLDVPWTNDPSTHFTSHSESSITTPYPSSQISSGRLHSDIDHLSAMSPPNTASPASSTTPIISSLILSGYFQSDIEELDDIFIAILSPSSSCQPSEPPQPEVALIDFSNIALSQLSETNVLSRNIQSEN